MLRRRLLALLAAIAAFCVVVCVSAAIVPFLLGLVYGCVPPTGSCGDSVGWAMIISSPVVVPIALLIAAIAATIAYVRVNQSGKPTGDAGTI